MNLRFHVVRDHFKDLCYVPTDLNKADPLTKGLVGSKYLSMFTHSDLSEADDYSNETEEIAHGNFLLGYTFDFDDI